MVVISLSVLAVLSSQAFGLKALAVDPVRTQASEITNRALLAAELALQNDFTTSVARAPEPDTEHPDFTVEVREEVEAPPDAEDEDEGESEDDPPPVLKRVTVTTTWEGKHGRESFELWTVFLDESALEP